MPIDHAHRQLDPSSTAASSKSKSVDEDASSPSEDDMAQIRASRAAKKSGHVKSIPPQSPAPVVDEDDDAEHQPRRQPKAKQVVSRPPRSPAPIVDEDDDAEHQPRRQPKAKQVVSRPPRSLAPVVDEDDDVEHQPRRQPKAKQVVSRPPQSPAPIVDEDDDAEHQPHRQPKAQQVVSRPPRSPALVIDEDDIEHQPRRRPKAKQVVSRPPQSPAPVTDEDDDAEHQPRSSLQTKMTKQVVAESLFGTSPPEPNKEISLPPKLKAGANRGGDRFCGDVYDNVRLYQDVGHCDPKGSAMPLGRADSPLSEPPDDLDNGTTSNTPVSVPTKRVNRGTTANDDDMVAQPAQKRRKVILKPPAAPAKRNPTRKNRANGF